MNNFIFQNGTKIYFGKDQIDNLPTEVLKYGRRALFVYGGGSIKRIGLYDKVMNLLRSAGIEVSELSGVEPNPRHTTVNKGAIICRDKQIDVVLAVGGGSTIDCSKAIAATALANTDDVWELIEGKVRYEIALPLITVLTVAATGSEMDGGAVISNMEKNAKFALHSPLLLPKVSFENPEYTFSVPAYQTACGSFDIMSHILDVEYFSQSDTMDMLKCIQEDVLKTVIKFAPVAIAKPDDYEARANLMWASTWALNGFLYDGYVQPTVCHWMEHELSAYYDITHGHGLAIVTPRWLKYVLDEKTAPDIQRFGVNCFGVTPSLSPMEGAQKAIDALSDFLFNKLGLKSRLSELGIDDKHFAAMARSACRGGILNGFKPLNQNDVEAIYRMCL
jgi:alcohol dehydrogenase YqhD (iron-dependent ADH family)